MTDERRELWGVVGDPDPLPTEGMTRDQAVNSEIHGFQFVCRLEGMPGEGFEPRLWQCGSAVGALRAAPSRWRPPKAKGAS